VAIGYTQYFNGVPALLVGFHVLGAVTVWVCVLRLALVLGRSPADGPLRGPSLDREPARA